MKMMIDDVKLNLLIEQKKDFIGKRIVWDSVLSSISFLFSAMMSTYHDIFFIPGKILKAIFLFLGLLFSLKSIVDVYKSVKNRYNFDDLLQDIGELNEIAHNHSLIVIKDSFNRFPNRFLVYDDIKWSCKLFLNYKENPNNEGFIRNHISNELKVDPDKIKLKYIAQKFSQKRSPNTDEEKLFSHKFYLADIEEFPEIMKNDSFECDGKRYYWKSINELEQDEDVKEKNMDIIGFIKELF